MGPYVISACYNGRWTILQNSFICSRRIDCGAIIATSATPHLCYSNRITQSLSRMTHIWIAYTFTHRLYYRIKISASRGDFLTTARFFCKFATATEWTFYETHYDAYYSTSRKTSSLVLIDRRQSVLIASSKRYYRMHLNRSTASLSADSLEMRRQIKLLHV